MHLLYFVLDACMDCDYGGARHSEDAERRWRRGGGTSVLSQVLADVLAEVLVGEVVAPTTCLMKSLVRINLPSRGRGNFM